MLDKLKEALATKRSLDNPLEEAMRLEQANGQRIGNEIARAELAGDTDLLNNLDQIHELHRRDCRRLGELRRGIKETAEAMDTLLHPNEDLSAEDLAASERSVDAGPGQEVRA